MTDDLLRLWEQRWPDCPPLAHELKSSYEDRWVRFHSLPESKRYAETEDEYEVLLGRTPWPRSALIPPRPIPSYTHLYARRTAWQRGAVDDLLRSVADDDVILASTEERDRLRERHADWLSKHPTGL